MNVTWTCPHCGLITPIPTVDGRLVPLLQLYADHQPACPNTTRLEIRR